MNNSDNQVLSRATMQLLLNNQKMAEKVKSVKSQLLRHKKSATTFHGKFLIEKQKNEKLQKMAATLFMKCKLRCACEDQNNCNNDLCQNIAELSATLSEKKRPEQEKMEDKSGLSSDSSSSSSSESSSTDSE